MNALESRNKLRLDTKIGKSQRKAYAKPTNSNQPTVAEMKELRAMLSKGHLAEGEQYATKITQRFPRDSFGWKVLGAILQEQGRLSEAESCYKKALEISPDSAQMHFNIGVMLSAQSRFSEAIACYQQALIITPDSAEFHANLGAAFQSLGRMKEAGACYRKAINIDPNHVMAYTNLAITLLGSGDFAEAEVCCRNALAVDSHYAEAYNILGLVLGRMARFSEAESAYQQALECNPAHSIVPINLSGALITQGELSRAEDCIRKALVNLPQDVNLHINLGLVYMLQGHLYDAEASFSEALKIKPNSTMAQGNLLFAMSYSATHTVDDCIKQARQYGHIVAAKVDEVFTTWQSDTQANRLRVGLVSGDFRQHAVTYFLENLLQHIDPSRIELIAYPTDGAADDVTTRLKPHFSAWKPLVELSDKAAAQLIHDDAIHVLIDLSGHTAFGRLPLFAWKPAPVQASWLGYWATTGVNEMDYFIADKVSIPEPNKIQFTEKIKYLPDTRLCFTPPNVAVDVSPLPALVNGYITFGCFQNMTKVGDDVLHLWSQVINALPNARLRWQCQPLVDAAVAEVLMQRLVKCGIRSSNVTLLGSVSREAYLAAHAEVDVILDSFPFTGGTTTCEALWMGVPTLTLAGNSLIARQGASLLTAAGLGNWVAESQVDYVSKAMLFTSDLKELANLRAELRAQVLLSPLFDAPRFAKNMEIALWEMWSDSQSIQTKQDTFNSKKQSLVNPADRLGQPLKLGVQIVSATRFTENDFWSKSALGLSLKRHLKQDERLSINITFENSLGLSEVFNHSIDHADEDSILVFIHDDVWIDEANFADTVIAGLEQFDVIGISGNRRRLPNQPAWAFIDAQLTWDDTSNLSGRIAHGKSAFGKVSDYGAAPAECELLGGVFIATKKSSLKNNNVRFDTQFDYHFYDMDFCRSARRAGLKLGTWLVNLTHQNAGAFGSMHWKQMYQLYLNKWEVVSTQSEIAFSQHEDTESENDLQQAINEVLQIALEHQNAGRVDQAEHLYLEIIDIQPKHAEANHNLGVIEASYKGANAALPRFEIAVQNKPENEQYWVSYIDALMQSGASDTATLALEAGQKYGLKKNTAQILLAEFNEATKKEQNLKQTVSEVFQMALESQNAGQFDQAEQLYLEILNIQPKNADASHNLGVIEAGYKGANVALPRFEVAVLEKPENEQYWVSYIDALVQSGDTSAAVEALALGEKYGLTSETAQILASEFIHLYQICDSGKGKQNISSDFVEIGHATNNRQDWGSYLSIRSYLQETKLNESDYYGFFSPKFKATTNLDAASVMAFIREHAREADVFLFSPFFDQGALHRNILLDSADSIQDRVTAFQECAKMIAPTVDLATLVMDSRNIVFCNYFVAKPAFWRAWLEGCELVFSEAEENKTVLALSLNAYSNGKDGSVQNKVLVIERVASLLLSTQPGWKVKAYNSLLLPYANSSIVKFSQELLQLDALKAFSATHGFPLYMPMFSQIRRPILDGI